MQNNKVALAIPTYNAGSGFEEVLKEVLNQSFNLELVKIYDSESYDETVEIVQKYNFDIEIISKESFSHSGTRTMIAKQMLEMNMDYLIL